MTSYPDGALAMLKARGYRVTKPRRLVLEALDQARAPLSPYEVAQHLRLVGERADAASIYRIFHTLEANGLVHRIIANGKYRKCQLAPEDECERHQTQHCHHSLVCRVCGRIEEFHCPGLNLVEQAIAAQTRFAIESHALEFAGVCDQCHAH
ncbi:MAG: fur [Cyanobacteria bacterium RYN_339]|nr:fur [Cyanobacteria bacterium RYN_339]